MSSSTLILYIFAGLGLRDIIYNCNISLLRTRLWKRFLQNNSILRPQQDLYNEIFCSFAVQHTMMSIAFTVVGILCLVNPPPVTFIQALFLHHFAWEISMFIRDFGSYNPQFRKLHIIKQALMITTGMVWIALGIFQHLAGIGGFFVLTFLGSTITLSMSYFVRMFRDGKERSSCILETILYVACRIWRWTIFFYGIYLVYVYKHPEAEENMFGVVTLMICGILFELLEGSVQTRNLWLMWKNYRELCQQQKGDDGSKDISCESDEESAPATSLPEEISPNPSPTHDDEEKLNVGETQFSDSENDSERNDENSRQQQQQGSYLETESQIGQEQVWLSSQSVGANSSLTIPSLQQPQQPQQQQQQSNDNNDIC